MKWLSQISLLALLMLLLAAGTGFSQNDDKGNKSSKGKSEKIDSKAERPADSIDVQQSKADTVDRKAKGNQQKKGNQDKAKEQKQGNAYGKNKGDMTGREFGQARAAAAKKLKGSIDSLDQKIDSAEVVAEKAEKEIERAEEKLEEEELDEEEKREKRQRIEKARQQLFELKEMIKKEKAGLQNAREKLEVLKDKDDNPEGG